MDSTLAKKTIYQLSYLRVFACIAIVVLHTTFAANEYFSDVISIGQNVASRAVEHNMMWAVPIFLMVTGALLLNPKKEIPYSKLFGKYILRIVLAIVIFSIIFRILDIAMGAEPSTVKSFFTGFGEIITGKSWGHMWYLYLLVGLYILMPFYRKIAAHSTDKELLYLAAAYTLFISLIPILNSFGIDCGFYLCTTIVYPLYLFLGHMIHENKLRIGLGAGIGITAGTTVLLIVLTIVGCSSGIEWLDYFFEYNSILVILQTIGVFAILNGIGNRVDLNSPKLGAFNRIMSSLDDCSFGIYLWHMAGIRFLFRAVGFNPYYNGGGLAIAASVIAFFIASYILTWLLKRIKIVNRVL